MPDWSLWLPICAGLLAVNVVCFALYALDKSAAGAGARRIPERTLLAAGLAGGWPAGIAAQRLLRHKTRKRSFRSAFRMTVWLNIGAVVGVASYAASTGLLAAT